MSLETTALPEEAIRFLNEFYEEKRISDAPASKKIEVLKDELGGEIHLYACGGEITEDITLSNLEHDFLCEEGVLVRELC